MSRMRTMRTARESRRSRQAGLSMIELLIAMLVLMVGMMGTMILIRNAIVTNNRNKLDTSATALSQMVLEQVTTRPSTLNTTFTITDCAGVVRTINPTGAAAPLGAGALLIQAGAYTGDIDYTQNLSAVPAGYSMTYLSCGPVGEQVTYEIRWNVITMTGLTKLVTVSARKQITTNTGSLPFYSMPVTLRGISGP